jgi:hypothetical protein
VDLADGFQGTVVLEQGLNSTSGAAGLTKPFTAAADVNGRTILGVHLGLVFRF